MARFIMVYKGEATDVADMSPDDAQALMAAWGTWMGKVGSALDDVGSPFGPGASLVDDGSVGAAAALTGYSIVEAADLESARQLADGHPYLSEGKGNYSIELYELMPVPFED